VKAARYTSASAAPAGSLCAGHVQQLGGESPLPELMCPGHGGNRPAAKASNRKEVRPLCAAVPGRRIKVSRSHNSS
jgi:hypothetical protein